MRENIVKPFFQILVMKRIEKMDVFYFLVFLDINKTSGYCLRQRHFIAPKIVIDLIGEEHRCKVAIARTTFYRDSIARPL